MNFEQSEFDISLNDTDGKVIVFLLDNGNIIPSQGVSLNDIKIEKPNGDYIAKITITNSIYKLREHGFVQEGIKKGRAKTYFISEKGIALYKHLFGLSKKIKENITSALIGISTGFDSENGNIDYDSIVNEVLESKKLLNETIEKQNN